MKKKILLLGCFLFSIHVYGEEINDGIIKSIQKDMFNVSVAAYAFCIPEFVSVLESDSTLLPKFCENMSGQLGYLKHSKDVYYAELLKIQFFKDSLISYYSANKVEVVYQLIDLLEKVPTYTLQQDHLYLFFKSFTDESGVGAEKIETLLATQNLQIVFEYIEKNGNAKKRLLRWIDEEIEVWCPSFGDTNKDWNDRIIIHLYDRLRGVNSPLAQQAVNKMKSWFGF
jgi:hypothetical protein